MKKFSLKALGVAILTLGFVVAGAALPANAGTLTSASVTSTGTIGTSGTNAYPITVAATTITATGQFVITLPTGWTPTFFGGPTCGGITLTGINITNTGCNVSGNVITLYGSDGNTSAPIPTGAKTVTFAVGKLNTAAARDFVLASSNSGTAVDSVTVTLASASSSYTVTFNSNGGSGAMADQSASAATALSANAFTRSGYTFAGWNTAADGSGTAYADGASFPFSANATLYAQWTATLATTGFDAAPYLYGGLALALTGGALMLIARRKQSN